MARLTDFDLTAFVEASCERSGVPVKLTDAAVRSQVALLLSGRAIRGDAPASHGRRPSDSPDEINPVRVEHRTALVGSGDHGMIQDRFDDRVLPRQVEIDPLTA